MTDKLTEEVKEEMLKQIPLARFGEAKDIAKVVVFLASDRQYIQAKHSCRWRNGYVTGQALAYLMAELSDVTY